MIRNARQSNPVAALLLALFFVGGQSGGLLHAFEHDAGTLQGQSCATCVTASQLGHGCIDTVPADIAAPGNIAPRAEQAWSCASSEVPTARQRGPPHTP